MEDQKGPGPKKKVLVRKSTVTREPYVLDETKESPSTEPTYGNYKVNMTPEEVGQQGLIASGATQGLEYSSVNKKLSSPTPEELKEKSKKLGKILPEEIGYYLRKKIGYTGTIDTNSALNQIDSITKIVSEKGEKIKTPADVKSLLEGPYRAKALEKAGLSEDKFKTLTENGSDKGKENIYYSILQHLNNNYRENLDPLKITQSSFTVEPLEKSPAPESETVVENKPDSAFKQVKDSKGAVRMVKKD